MSLYEKIINREEKLSLVGLGYVGMPIAVAHKEFKTLSLDKIDSFYKKLPNSEKVIIDVKSMLDKKEIKSKGYSYWCL